MTIFQLQDLLKLDNSGRMNWPGTVGDPNWTWKLKDFSFMKEVSSGGMIDVYFKKWPSTFLLTYYYYPIQIIVDSGYI
jgi:hypothetical protein